MSDETLLPDGFESITVTANGTRLHAVVGGSGAPVLLLHGRCAPATCASRWTCP